MRQERRSIISHRRHAAWTLVIGLALACPGIGARPVAAQAGSIDAAHRLRDQGRYGAAADTLLAYLRSHPNEGGVRWMAAQMLARDGRTGAARAEYDSALRLMPVDEWLRIEYAEFLLTNGSWETAATVADQVLDIPGAPPQALARAHLVVGTRAYWRGDLPRAMQRLEAALALDPGNAEARRELAEIRASIRPSIEAAAELLDDSQPYRRYEASAGGSVWLTPLWAAAGRGTSRTLDAGVARRVLEALIELRGALPGSRMAIATRVGTTTQSGLPSATLAGGELRFQPGAGTALRAIWDRTRYLSTSASADTLLMVDGLELRLDRAGAPRWAGELSLRRDRFADGNAIITAYGWALAPLGPHVRAGYAISWQDARESRWSSSLGRYDPYFTPIEQRTHTALGEVVARGSRATGRLDASWGFHATEIVPDGTRNQPGRGRAPGATPSAVRSFTPWKVRASLEELHLGGLSLHLEAARESTLFYRITRAGITAAYRFGASSDR